MMILLRKNNNMETCRQKTHNMMIQVSGIISMNKNQNNLNTKAKNMNRLIWMICLIKEHENNFLLIPQINKF